MGKKGLEVKKVIRGDNCFWRLPFLGFPSMLFRHLCLIGVADRSQNSLCDREFRLLLVAV
jgi:hypothetical protein